MSLKKLSQFMKFDWEGFSKGKEFLVLGTSKWVDFETKADMGTKVEVLIAKDETPYKQKDGETVSNRFEKLTLKIRKDVKVPPNAHVIPVGAAGTVYGDYRNQLSVTADDIRVITPRKQQEGGLT